MKKIIRLSTSKIKKGALVICKPKPEKIKLLSTKVEMLDFAD